GLRCRSLHNGQRRHGEKRSEYLPARLETLRHGLRITQRCRSEPESNADNVAKLLPTADSAMPEAWPGTARGIRRQLPSVSWSMRHICSGAPLNAGSTTSSASAVAASVRSVPAMRMRYHGAPG